MKRGNYKTRKAWKQDVCRRSHGTAPMGHGHIRVPAREARGSFKNIVAAMLAPFFRRGVR